MRIIAYAHPFASITSSVRNQLFSFAERKDLTCLATKLGCRISTQTHTQTIAREGIHSKLAVEDKKKEIKLGGIAKHNFFYDPSLVHLTKNVNEHDRKSSNLFRATTSMILELGDANEMSIG